MALSRMRHFVRCNDACFVLFVWIWPVKDACSCGTCVRRLSRFLPHKVQLSHINKIHNTIKYMNAALLEERAQNTMVHFGVAATCVPQPGSSSCMSATRDDHVVKLQINFAGTKKTDLIYFL